MKGAGRTTKPPRLPLEKMMLSSSGAKSMKTSRMTTPRGSKFEYKETPEFTNMRKNLMRADSFNGYKTSDLMDFYWKLRDYAYYCALKKRYTDATESEKLLKYLKDELEHRGQHVLSSRSSENPGNIPELQAKLKVDLDNFDEESSNRIQKLYEKQGEEVMEFNKQWQGEKLKPFLIPSTHLTQLREAEKNLVSTGDYEKAAERRKEIQACESQEHERAQRLANNAYREEKSRLDAKNMEQYKRLQDIILTQRNMLIAKQNQEIQQLKYRITVLKDKEDKRANRQMKTSRHIQVSETARSKISREYKTEAFGLLPPIKPPGMSDSEWRPPTSQSEAEDGDFCTPKLKEQKRQVSTIRRARRQQSSVVSESELASGSSNALEYYERTPEMKSVDGTSIVIFEAAEGDSSDEEMQVQRRPNLNDEQYFTKTAVKNTKPLNISQNVENHELQESDKQISLTANMKQIIKEAFNVQDSASPADKGIEETQKGKREKKTKIKEDGTVEEYYSDGDETTEKNSIRIKKQRTKESGEVEEYYSEIEVGENEELVEEEYYSEQEIETIKVKKTRVTPEGAIEEYYSEVEVIIQPEYYSDEEPKSIKVKKTRTKENGEIEEYYSEEEPKRIKKDTEVRRVKKTRKNAANEYEEYYSEEEVEIVRDEGQKRKRHRRKPTTMVQIKQERIVKDENGNEKVEEYLENVEVSNAKQNTVTKRVKKHIIKEDKEGNPINAEEYSDIEFEVRKVTKRVVTKDENGNEEVKEVETEEEIPVLKQEKRKVKKTKVIKDSEGKDIIEEYFEDVDVQIVNVKRERTIKDSEGNDKTEVYYEEIEIPIEEKPKTKKVKKSRFTKRQKEVPTVVKRVKRQRTVNNEEGNEVVETYFVDEEFPITKKFSKKIHAPKDISQPAIEYYSEESSEGLVEERPSAIKTTDNLNSSHMNVSFAGQGGESEEKEIELEPQSNFNKKKLDSDRNQIDELSDPESEAVSARKKVETESSKENGSKPNEEQRRSNGQNDEEHTKKDDKVELPMTNAAVALLEPSDSDSGSDSDKVKKEEKPQEPEKKVENVPNEPKAVEEKNVASGPNEKIDETIRAEEKEKNEEKPKNEKESKKVKIHKKHKVMKDVQVTKKEAQRESVKDMPKNMMDLLYASSSSYYSNSEEKEMVTIQKEVEEEYSAYEYEQEEESKETKKKSESVEEETTKENETVNEKSGNDSKPSKVCESEDGKNTEEENNRDPKEKSKLAILIGDLKNDIKEEEKEKTKIAVKSERSSDKESIDQNKEINQESKKEESKDDSYKDKDKNKEQRKSESDSKDEKDENKNKNKDETKEKNAEKIFDKPQSERETEKVTKSDKDEKTESDLVTNVSSEKNDGKNMETDKHSNYENKSEKDSIKDNGTESDGEGKKSIKEREKTSDKDEKKESDKEKEKESEKDEKKVCKEGEKELDKEKNKKSNKDEKNESDKEGKKSNKDENIKSINEKNKISDKDETKESEKGKEIESDKEKKKESVEKGKKVCKESEKESDKEKKKESFKEGKKSIKEREKASEKDEKKESEKNEKKESEKNEKKVCKEGEKELDKDEKKESVKEGKKESEKDEKKESEKEKEKESEKDEKKVGKEGEKESDSYEKDEKLKKSLTKETKETASKVMGSDKSEPSDGKRMEEEGDPKSENKADKVLAETDKDEKTKTPLTKETKESASESASGKSNPNETETNKSKEDKKKKASQRKDSGKPKPKEAVKEKDESSSSESESVSKKSAKHEKEEEESKVVIINPKAAKELNESIKESQNDKDKETKEEEKTEKPKNISEKEITKIDEDNESKKSEISEEEKNSPKEEIVKEKDNPEKVVVNKENNVEEKVKEKSSPKKKKSPGKKKSPKKNRKENIKEEEGEKPIAKDEEKEENIKSEEKESPQDKEKKKKKKGKGKKNSKPKNGKGKKKSAVASPELPKEPEDNVIDSITSDNPAIKSDNNLDDNDEQKKSSKKKPRRSPSKSPKRSQVRKRNKEVQKETDEAEEMIETPKTSKEKQALFITPKNNEIGTYVEEPASEEASEEASYNEDDYADYENENPASETPKYAPMSLRAMILAMGKSQNQRGSITTPMRSDPKRASVIVQRPSQMHVSTKPNGHSRSTDNIPRLGSLEADQPRKRRDDIEGEDDYDEEYPRKANRKSISKSRPNDRKRRNLAENKFSRIQEEEIEEEDYERTKRSKRNKGNHIVDSSEDNRNVVRLVHEESTIDYPSKPDPTLYRGADRPERAVDVEPLSDGFESLNEEIPRGQKIIVFSPFSKEIKKLRSSGQAHRKMLRDLNDPLINPASSSQRSPVGNGDDVSFTSMLRAGTDGLLGRMRNSERLASESSRLPDTPSTRSSAKVSRMRPPMPKLRSGVTKVMTPKYIK